MSDCCYYFFCFICFGFCFTYLKRCPLFPTVLSDFLFYLAFFGSPWSENFLFGNLCLALFYCVFWKSWLIYEVFTVSLICFSCSISLDRLLVVSSFEEFFESKLSLGFLAQLCSQWTPVENTRKLPNFKPKTKKWLTSLEKNKDDILLILKIIYQ